MEKSNKKAFFALFFLALIVIFFLFFKGSDRILSTVYVELGTQKLDISSFVKSQTTNAELISGLSKEQLKEAGEYKVLISYNNKEIESTVIVQDTTAPGASMIDATAWVNEPIDAKNFISIIRDYSTVEISYVTDPDFSVVGEQEVQIQLTDTSGNKSIQKAILTVNEDTEAPIIEGTKNMTVYLGNTVSYRDGVTVTDNKDENVSLSIDSSKVNLNAEGTYDVIYSAIDNAGNKQEITIQITVKKKPSNTINADTVNEMADAVLENIINDSMSQYEKIQKIYNYVRNNVSYRDGTNKPGWVVAAYNGLKYKSGDCYVFWATSKVLLTRAGIQNVDIKKSDTTISGHYWNLVNIGAGYYHFDTTPRKGGFDGFYLTDAQLKAYSEAHDNSHIYDASLYPTIQ